MLAWTSNLKSKSCFVTVAISTEEFAVAIFILFRGYVLLNEISRLFWGCWLFPVYWLLFRPIGLGHRKDVPGTAADFEICGATVAPDA